MLSFFLLLIIMGIVFFGTAGFLFYGEHVVALFKTVHEHFAERARRKAEELERAEEKRRAPILTVSAEADAEELDLARQIAEQRARKQHMLALQAQAADEWEREFNRAMGIELPTRAHTGIGSIRGTPDYKPTKAVVMTPTGAVPVDVYVREVEKDVLKAFAAPTTLAHLRTSRTSRIGDAFKKHFASQPLMR